MTFYHALIYVFAKAAWASDGPWTAEDTMARVTAITTEVTVEALMEGVGQADMEEVEVEAEVMVGVVVEASDDRQVDLSDSSPVVEHSEG